MNDMLLMNKDIPIMKINVDEGIYDILNKEMMPYQLKGKIQKVKDFSEIKTRYDDTQRMISLNKNYQAILEYLSSRVLPITRQNAKKIYELFGFEQLQDDVSKAQIAITCRAVSLQDNYWVKLENDNAKWKDISLRNNSLSEIVAQVSLHGSSLTLQGRIMTPELNGQGAYAKAWKREEGELYLYKAGSNDEGYESKIEVSVSNILDCCNVDHIKYELAKSQNTIVCKCKCMTTEAISILPGLDFISYCNVNNLNPNKEMFNIDKTNLYKMWIVDYLISNRDRHGLNWGFMYDANTMQILGCHPLYDHNNAFDTELIKNEKALYLFDKRFTMKQAAIYALERADFYFTKEIIPNLFLNRDMYDSFMSKANELHIRTISKEDYKDDISLD